MDGWVARRLGGRVAAVSAFTRVESGYLHDCDGPDPGPACIYLWLDLDSHSASLPSPVPPRLRSPSPSPRVPSHGLFARLILSVRIQIPPIPPADPTTYGCCWCNGTFVLGDRYLHAYDVGTRSAYTACTACTYILATERCRENRHPPHTCHFCMKPSAISRSFIFLHSRTILSPPVPSLRCSIAFLAIIVRTERDE